jgi:hypothetical protein
MMIEKRRGTEREKRKYNSCKDQQGKQNKNMEEVKGRSDRKGKELWDYG